jgi:hypothetical protein
MGVSDGFLVRSQMLVPSVLRPSKIRLNCQARWEHRGDPLASSL